MSNALVQNYRSLNNSFKFDALTDLVLESLLTSEATVPAGRAAHSVLCQLQKPSDGPRSSRSVTLAMVFAMKH